MQLKPTDFNPLVSFRLDSSIKLNYFASQSFFNHRMHDSVEEPFIVLDLLENCSQKVFVVFTKS